MWPEHRNVIETKEVRVVQKIEKVVIPKPSNVKYEPLKNPDEACHGAPVVITTMSIAPAQGADQNYTWMSVRPVGDEYTVLCYLGGDYSDHWKVGDIVSMAGGKITGKE
jgi:hypothetical protein